MAHRLVLEIASTVVLVEQAKEVGDSHEECGTNPLCSKAMDLNNNDIGSGVATSGNTCYGGCLGAVLGGYTMNSTPTGNCSIGDPYREGYDGNYYEDSYYENSY